MLPIDLVDNGALSPASAGPLLSGMVLPSLMETLKPVFDDTDPEAEDSAFTTALTIARTFVEVRIAATPPNCAPKAALAFIASG